MKTINETIEKVYGNYPEQTVTAFIREVSSSASPSPRD